MKNSIILHPSTKAQVDAILLSKNLNSIGIYGEKGAGKKFLAKYLLENILGIDNALADPYVKNIDCADKVGIEEIRDIKVFLRLLVPTNKSYSRGVIISNIELLGIPAQNALLKTLEEPPKGTIIVVTNSGKNAVLPTIISRLQWLRVLPVPRQQIDQELKTVGQSELDKAFVFSGGNVGGLLSILNDAEVQTYHEAAIEQAKFLIKSTRLEKLSNVDSIIKNDVYTVDQLLQAMAKVIRLVLQKSPTQQNSLRLIDMLDNVVKSQELLKYNLSQKLILTSLFNKL